MALVGTFGNIEFDYPIEAYIFDVYLLFMFKHFSLLIKIFWLEKIKKSHRSPLVYHAQKEHQRHFRQN